MTNKLTILGLVLAASGVNAAPCGAQSIEVRVDPRVELISTVFRLAGRAEYNRSRVPKWSAAVDSQLQFLKDHEAVAMTRRLRFGFFIPMSLAIHLTDPPDLAARSPFSNSKSLHRRWTEFPDSTARFVELIRDFSRLAEFPRVLARQKALSDSARARLQRVANTVDARWVEQFWGGAAPEKFVLVAALANGTASYGQSYVGQSSGGEFYAILGVSRVDARQGYPLFDSTDAPTILHEMNHPFVTPLVRANAEAFGSFGDSLYATVAPRMREQSYGGWDAMINESMVRAAVVRYLMAHGDLAAAERAVEEQVALGFVWTRRLSELLGEYESNRATFRTMSDFMPRIIDLFRGWPRG